MGDFFISYTGADQGWAEWIAWQLEEAGYTVVLQKWDFRPGSNFPLNMDQAAREATSTIAVLSPAYLQGAFTRPEWAAAFAADPTGTKRSLIPIRVVDCQLDGLLSTIIYIDLVGLAEDDAKQALLQGIADKRAKPTAAPIFPGSRSTAPLLKPSFPGRKLQSSDPAVVLRDTFAVLRACPTGVPDEVLADVERVAVDEFERHCACCLDKNLLKQDCQLLSLSDDSHTVEPEPSPDLLGRALDALLRYYEKHRRDAKSRHQLENVVALTRRCAEMQVGPVARVFNVVEKGLKSLGDKALVLEVAQLSITACQRQPRGKQEVEWEAQALVCGVCWVYQRRGQLEDARAAAEKSLHLGEQIAYDRNTSFCYKCLGRLYRIMGEADKANRKQFITKSTEHLREAIKRFSAMPPPDFGPDSEEVGDCYSLLGRTFLSARRRHDAEDATRRATHLLHDRASKDYSDLLILTGDLQAAREQYEAAIGSYDEAVALGKTDDAERSEILARALFSRGRSRAALGRKQAARRDFHRAQAIWKSLKEPEGVARSRWEEIRLDNTLSPGDAALLQAHPARVRVIAYERHQERLSALPKARARRAATPRQYWEQLLKEAERQVAIEGPGW